MRQDIAEDIGALLQQRAETVKAEIAISAIEAPEKLNKLFLEYGRLAVAYDKVMMGDKPAETKQFLAKEWNVKTENN